MEPLRRGLRAGQPARGGRREDRTTGDRSLNVTPDRIAAGPDQTAGVAFVHLATGLVAAFDAQLHLTAQSDAAEPVLKARVALRRLRVAVTAFEAILTPRVTKRLQGRSRVIFRLLGEIRDADVVCARCAGDDRAEAMAQAAADQRRKGRKRLRRKKADRFAAEVTTRLTAKGWRRSDRKAQVLRHAPVALLAAKALDRAWATCRSHGPQVPQRGARAQHDLRKDLKSLRYLSEFFAPVWPGAAQDGFLATLRRLQDDLGELADIAMARSKGLPGLAAGPSGASVPSGALVRAAGNWQALLAQGPWWR